MVKTPRFYLNLFILLYFISLNRMTLHTQMSMCLVARNAKEPFLPSHSSHSYNVFFTLKCQSSDVVQEEGFYLTKTFQLTESLNKAQEPTLESS